MPTHVCVRCKQAIPLGEVRHGPDGQTYDEACLQSVAGTFAPGVVITGLRIPFADIFSVVSQVVGVLALFSFLGWLFVSCLTAGR